MPRPCDHATGEPRPDMCAVCAAYVRDARLREKWDGPPASKTIPLTILNGRLRNPKACGYLGEKLGAQPCGDNLHRCRLDGIVCATVHSCDRWPEGHKDRPTRSCQDCPHHPAAKPVPIPPQVLTPPDPWKNLVRIPPVPKLNLSPKRPRAVVTIAAGRYGKEMLVVTGPMFRQYAERLDADYVVLDWPGVASWPMSSKFVLTRILDHYEQVCYLDADVVIRPTVVDLFSVCAYDELAAFNDLPIVLSVYPEFAKEFVDYRRLLGLSTGIRNPIPYYVNTGVMVFSQAHREVFTLPDKSVPPIHCGEQHWWVSRILDLGVKTHFLPATHNYQWWAVDGFRRGEVPDDAILHFSGMNTNGTNAEKHTERLRLMREWAGVARTVRIRWPAVPLTPLTKPITYNQPRDTHNTHV